MFYYISGTLAHKEDGFAVIDAGGVGYKLLTSLGSLDRLGAVGSDAKMYTHLYVREGIFDLYGFASEEELNMFLLLTGVSEGRARRTGRFVACCTLACGRVGRYEVDYTRQRRRAEGGPAHCDGAEGQD